MSLAFAKRSLAKFIESDVPEVLCLRGKWGVGKTFAWNQILTEAIDEKRVALPAYSYVSLFGLNSIDELRQSIFENESATKGQQPTFEERVKAYSRSAAQKVSRYVSYAKVPYLDSYVSNFAGGFRHIVSETVKNTIICIDDVERKGKSLRAADILGVVSQLKEAKGCKIVFILNADALSEDDKKEFATYLEKVIDAVIDFELTPQETLEIALRGSDEVHGLLRTNCEDLRIGNIRVIKKIERLALQIEEFLRSNSQQLRKDIIRSLTVLAWSIYSGEGAPTIEFLKSRQLAQSLGIGKKEALSEEEARWNRALAKYGFTHCDEVDLILIEGIQKGYFDEDRIAREVGKQQVVYEKSAGEAALTAAWRLYHGSFDHNEKEVAEELFEGSMANIKHLTPINLNALVSILKDIGHGDKAKTLLESYLRERADEPELFDLSSHPFRGEITEVDVIAAFERQAAKKLRTNPTPLEASKRIYKSSWSPEDEDTLAGLTTDDFFAWFKELRDDDLSVAVRGALSFRDIANATAQQKEISTRAEEALKRIASESELNRHRMAKFNL